MKQEISRKDIEDHLQTLNLKRNDFEILQPKQEKETIRTIKIRIKKSVGKGEFNKIRKSMIEKFQVELWVCP